MITLLPISTLQITDTKPSQSTFISLYVVTALHNNSSAMSSLDVSWYRILAMEILPASVACWLTLHSWTLTSTACSVDCLQDNSSARTLRKHRLLLSRMSVYWTVTQQWIYANHIENTSCDAGSIVTCAYFGRCLELGLDVTISRSPSKFSYRKGIRI
jgi:hypothetical protein